jgi:hypothetical protein
VKLRQAARLFWFIWVWLVSRCSGGPWPNQPGSNLKGQELANLACGTLGEAVGAAWQGVERVRRSWWLPYSFLRRAGLSVG